MTTMTGYNTVLKIRKFEDRIANLGMQMAHPKYNYDDYGTMIALKPLDNSYPVFARDAELFIGTIEEAEQWLNGIEWSTRYFEMLGLVNGKKIAAKEDLERQRQLIHKLREQPKIKENA